MDMANELDDITYRLLATAADATEARRRVAIVRHWADQQAERLAQGRPIRVDHAQVVSEALASLNSGLPVG